MKDDQIVRIASGLFFTVAYCARLAVHGNGPVQIFGYHPNSFVVLGIALLTLAVPEWLDKIPYGRSNQK